MSIVDVLEVVQVVVRSKAPPLDEGHGAVADEELPYYLIPEPSGPEEAVIVLFRLGGSYRLYSARPPTDGREETESFCQSLVACGVHIAEDETSARAIFELAIANAADFSQAH